MNKTMVERILDKKHIEYISHSYNSNELDAVTCAKLIGKDPKEVFKTLVTRGKSNNYYVFMIPSCMEMNLKRCAEITHEKSIEMIKEKELYPLTGYVHGGCSPIGMKKHLKTYIDISALNYETICYSAGERFHQVETKPKDLIDYFNVEAVKIIEEDI